MSLRLASPERNWRLSGPSGMAEQSQVEGSRGVLIITVHCDFPKSDFLLLRPTGAGQLVEPHSTNNVSSPDSDSETSNPLLYTQDDRFPSKHLTSSVTFPIIGSPSPSIFCRLLLDKFYVVWLALSVCSDRGRSHLFLQAQRFSHSQQSELRPHRFMLERLSEHPAVSSQVSSILFFHRWCF